MGVGGDGGDVGETEGGEASIQSNFKSPPRQSLRSAVSDYIRAADVWRMQNKGRTGWKLLSNYRTNPRVRDDMRLRASLGTLHYSRIDRQDG